MKNLNKKNIFKQVEKDFPKKYYRRYSVKFANYLKKISIENGFNVNSLEILKKLLKKL